MTDYTLSGFQSYFDLTARRNQYAIIDLNRCFGFVLHCTCHTLPHNVSSRMNVYILFVGYNSNRPELTLSELIKRERSSIGVSIGFAYLFIPYCTCHTRPVAVSNFKRLYIFSVLYILYLCGSKSAIWSEISDSIFIYKLSFVDRCCTEETLTDVES